MASCSGSSWLTGLCRIAILVAFGLIRSCVGGCYFPAELQGEFVMQLQFQSAGQQGLQVGQGAQAGIGHVQYSQVNISADNIPIWGRCHRRIGNNVILMDSSGSANCIRCFHLKLVARNVLQVHTEELSKCYTTEEAAERTCPDETTLRTRSKEILLYKTKELDGEDVIKEYCPISGRFDFTYNVNDGLENKQECPNSVSELNNCPSGNALNVRFKSCSFENHNITFECLGHWTGSDNQRYLALLDTRVDAVRRAQYRCAMYREDEATGMTYMAFSSDSTCATDLHSATQGYETLALRRVPANSWPTRVVAATCMFPQWAQGKWEHVSVQRNSLTFRDHNEMKTYSVRCIGPDQGQSAERFPVYYKTQCGEEKYSCVWLKQRGNNVLEFQIGLQESDRFNYSLCSPSNFREKIWVTQGRTDRVQESPCPITGEYNGLIPDAIGLCAKLSSDCANPEVMYYTVSDCNTEVYEERQYRCLGQWKEGDLVYTYTQRKDVGTYECFVGSIISQTEIYIKEAGEHCERDVDPLQHGMLLRRKGACIGTAPVPQTSTTPRPRTTTQWPITRRPVETHTKPWKPITAPPRSKPPVQSKAPSLHSTALSLFTSISIILLWKL